MSKGNKINEDKRRKRRATKAVSRKAALKARKNEVDVSSVSTDPAVQGVKIAALEHAINRIVQLTQANHGEIAKAFALTDAHLWVLRQICCDIVSGKVIMVEGTEPAVNLGAYHDLFNANQKRLAEEAEKKKAPNGAGVKISSPHEDEPEVFGGEAHVAST